MAVSRPLLGLAAIIILAGGLVMQFLVILSGTHVGAPVSHVYFLQSDTNGISGTNIPNPARWTYFSLCSETNGLNADCGKEKAAFPFDPIKNFGTSDGLTGELTHSKTFYYLSRVSWSFYLIATFFAVVAFFLSIFALCARLGAYLTGLNAALALLFQTLAASLMTAWTVLGRNGFRAAGHSTHLGIYAYGFTWGTWAAFFLSTLLFCIGGSVGRHDNTQKTSRFGRQKSTRSTRSRGSFIDSESQRRVKDEYE